MWALGCSWPSLCGSYLGAEEGMWHAEVRQPAVGLAVALCLAQILAHRRHLESF